MGRGGIGRFWCGIAHLFLWPGPMYSLALAFTFGMYGFIEKLAPLGTLHGLALETMMIFVPAPFYC